MDSVTQFTLGAALGEALLGRQLGVRAALIGGALGTLPDLDVLANPLLTEMQQLAVHRHFSHSLLFVALATPTLGWLLQRWQPRLPVSRWQWSVLVFWTLFTHSLLDCCTTYGTQIFQPFSDYPVALSSIFTNPDEAFPMAGKIFEYPGTHISIQYDAKRCIHAAECAHGLPAVFDPQRKPWVDANGANPDEIATVVARCPTGALHYSRHDGGPAEVVPLQNTITVEANGPLVLRGDLAIMGADGAVVLTDTRIALCRCGASANKPFCDGSHSKANFQDSGALGTNGVRTVATDAPENGLRITPAANGPLGVKGTVELRSADGQVCQSGNRVFLCRCGASANKPFCDGSHSTVGFTAG